MTADPRARRSPESILADDLRIETRARTDDAARIDRMVGGAMATTAGLGALWLVVKKVVSSKIVVVAVATATVTAATAWTISRPTASAVVVDTETAPRAAPQARAEAAVPAPAAIPPAVASDPAQAQAEAIATKPTLAEPTKPRPREVASPAEVQDADALLEAAARARKDGRTDDAIALYRELGRRFAGTREDGVGCVALGRLLLPRDATAALAVFDRCLTDHPRGDLVETALVGRAEALEKLGRTADERAAWSELLRRFPSTLHAERAEARLTE
jgi:hypothetical protein